MAWRRRQQLIFFGYSEAEILRLGNLSKLTDERMNELIHSNNLETVEKTLPTFSVAQRTDTECPFRILRCASLGGIKKMGMIKSLARKLWEFIGNDRHGFYVAGSGPVKVPNSRAHEIPKVIAEHHRENAKRELLKSLIGRH